MHAVLVQVAIRDHEAATNPLREQVVPGVSQAPGEAERGTLAPDFEAVLPITLRLTGARRFRL
jgi:hypothetical protein